MAEAAAMSAFDPLRTLSRSFLKLPCLTRGLQKRASLQASIRHFLRDPLGLMRRFRVLVVAATLFSGLSLCPLPSAAAPDSILGTWKLQSWVREIIATGKRETVGALCLDRAHVHREQRLSSIPQICRHSRSMFKTGTA